MNQSGHESKMYKKKKKKSYLSRAKKFGKSGRFGHGSHINEDTYNYFLRVFERSKGKFETDEEKEIFINNTFEMTVGQEVMLATNQFTSYALEHLIPNASHEPILRFMTALASDLRPICCDVFASHVFQSLLKSCSERIAKLQISQGEDAEIYTSKYSEWIVKIGRFLLNNMDEFAWETYANPIMRTVLEVTSGSEVTHGADKSKKKEEAPVMTKVPADLRKLFKDYCNTISTLPQLPDLTSSPVSSGLLQTLVKAAARVGVKRLVPLTEKLIEILKSKKQLDDPSARLVEAMLSVAPTPLFTQLYEEFYKGKLKDMVCRVGSNFSVQRLFDVCPDKDQLLLLMEEIGSAEVMESILKNNFTGVILAMGQACERLGAGQGNFMLNLMVVLKCSSPPEKQLKLANLVLMLQDIDEYEATVSRTKGDNKPLVTLHGSLLLQTLLKFNKPIKVVQSLLAMKPEELAAMLSDSKGSHITDAYMSSTFVGEKSREKLVQHLKGQWTGLACSVWGSRSLDSTWKAVPIKSRQNIVSELSTNISHLKGDKHGRYITEQFGVELFKRNSKEWAELQAKQMKAKKLFAEIIDDVPRKKIKKE